MARGFISAALLARVAVTDVENVRRLARWLASHPFGLSGQEIKILAACADVLTVWDDDDLPTPR